MQSCRWLDHRDVPAWTDGDVPLSCFLSHFLSCSCIFPLFALTVSVSLQNLHLQLLPQVSHPPLQGERCSFSVQMWFYFLCGLRSDLWAVLPADLAKEMLGQVLSETLQQLVQRYSSVRPSYRRQLQVRCYSCASKLDLFQLFFFSIVARSPFFYCGNLVYRLQQLSSSISPKQLLHSHLKTV